MPSAFLLAGRVQLAGQTPVASKSAPAFFLLKLENNNIDLCRREPAAKAGTSGSTISKPARSSFGGRRGRAKSFKARSITRRKLLNRLQMVYTLLRVIYIKKQLREIERKRRYDYYRNLKRARRRVFFLLARMSKAEKEAQTGPANQPSRTDRLLRVFSALEERARIKSGRETVALRGV